MNLTSARVAYQNGYLTSIQIESDKDESYRIYYFIRLYFKQSRSSIFTDNRSNNRRFLTIDSAIKTAVKIGVDSCMVYFPGTYKLFSAKENDLTQVFCDIKPKHKRLITDFINITPHAIDDDSEALLVALEYAVKSARHIHGLERVINRQAKDIKEMQKLRQSILSFFNIRLSDEQLLDVIYNAKEYDTDTSF